MKLRIKDPNGVLSEEKISNVASVCDVTTESFSVRTQTYINNVLKGSCPPAIEIGVTDDDVDHGFTWLLDALYDLQEILNNDAYAYFAFIDTKTVSQIATYLIAEIFFQHNFEFMDDTNSRYFGVYLNGTGVALVDKFNEYEKGDVSNVASK